MAHYRSKGTRRGFLKGALSVGIASFAGAICADSASAVTTSKLELPDGLPLERWDFETKGISDWTVVAGQWTVEDLAGAPSGKRVLVQRALQNTYNVIVAPSGPYSDVDVSVRFKPISGKEDASGGIVFRFTDGKYYLIRANALEDNFRFYYYDRGRSMITSARVRAPATGGWHTLRAVVAGDHIQGWLDDVLLLDSHDKRFAAGRVGLWTKTDSITAFDDLVIRGVSAGK
jgi:hypothetical protein